LKPIRSLQLYYACGIKQKRHAGKDYPSSYPCQHSTKRVALNTHYRDISNQQRLKEVIKNKAKWKADTHIFVRRTRYRCYFHRRFLSRLFGWPSFDCSFTFGTCLQNSALHIRCSALGDDASRCCSRGSPLFCVKPQR